MPKITDDTLMVVTISDGNGAKQISIYRYGDIGKLLLYVLVGGKDYFSGSMENITESTPSVIRTAIATDKEIEAFENAVGVKATMPLEQRVPDFDNFTKDHEDGRPL